MSVTLVSEGIVNNRDERIAELEDALEQTRRY